MPALVAALNDPRLTRSVDYGRDFVYSHEVITVGDAALQVIERIAGQKFYHNPAGRSMSLDGLTDSTRAKVQDWWDKQQKQATQ
jgi:hypothetical protein